MNKFYDFQTVVDLIRHCTKQHKRKDYLGTIMVVVHKYNKNRIYKGSKFCL